MRKIAAFLLVAFVVVAADRDEPATDTLTSPASALFAMVDRKAITPHIDALWSYVLAALDSVDYVNDTYADGTYLWPRDRRIAWRHALACMGYAMPSVARIEPPRTREVAWNLHLVARHLQDPQLTDTFSPYGSDNVMLVHRALIGAWYRLVTGRTDHDAEVRANARQIDARIRANAATRGAWALDTVQGSFEPPLNAMALLALAVHDRAFGGNLSEVRTHVLRFMEERLTDPDTGLFFEACVIPEIGLESERATMENAQIARALRPAGNALALTFLHPLAPREASRGWASFKDRFGSRLLEIRATDFGPSVAQSFYLPVGTPVDAFLGAMLAAREFDDPVFFGSLEDRLREIGAPRFTQGELRYDILTDSETTMINGLALLAKVHVGWQRLLDHDWPSSYRADFDRVR